jgi:DNA-directed RNA polymerase specialized sigma24 family protein
VNTLLALLEALRDSHAGALELSAALSDARRALILAAVASGETYQSIADAAGVSKARIGQIAGDSK